MRSKKAFKNTIYGLIYEAAVMICGLVVPRLVLTSFGSEYNGVTGVITQFLRVIALFQAGIGGVTMAALYKPLNSNDKEQISIIVKTTESYLRKVAFMFIGVSIIIACVLPFFVSEFDYIFTASLVLIMSLSTFAQYFFGQTYQFLLSADQRQRFMHVVNTVKVLANTAMSALLIRLGFSIHIVMLGSAVVFAIAPIFVYVYTNKKYTILKKVKPDNNVLNQRWDNFGTQVSNFITINTSLIVLSVFSTMPVVSVYTTYYLVTAGIFGLFSPFVSGIAAAFGNMLAKNEQDLLQKNIRLYEQVVFSLSTFLLGVAAAMIIFFVDLYTRNVADANIYYQPLFAYLLIAATLFRTYRYPYMGITQAAGHFKQNRNLSYVEAGINIVASVTLAIILEGHYKLVGVAISTLFAYAFRTIRYAMYMSKHIIPRSYMLFVKRIGLSIIMTAAIAVLPNILHFTRPSSWMAWVQLSVIISIIAFALTAIVEVVFYKNDLRALTKMAMNAIKKRKPLLEQR